MTSDLPNPPVTVATRTCAEGALGLLILNRPAQLNALTGEMIGTLQAQLEEWRDDETIALVVIGANGNRAFCAGGDVHQITTLADSRLSVTESAAFFAAEYRLDYTLHQYPKPVVCWSQGLILGGGMGLLQAARYRLGTPDAQMAMPEILTGLFPDAGASWFLNRLPEGVGRFLGLTGAMVNSSDALRLGLLDHVVAGDGFARLLAKLEAARWGHGVAADDNRLYRLLQQFAQDNPVSLPQGQLSHYEQEITRLCQDGDVKTVVEAVLQSSPGSQWWEQARDNLAGGCPTSAHLFFALLEHGRQMTFADIFRLELGVATRCIRSADFLEGVRALLIERDRKPRWQFSDVRDVPGDCVELFFQSPWPSETHPLRDL